MTFLFVTGRGKITSLERLRTIRVCAAGPQFADAAISRALHPKRRHRGASPAESVMARKPQYQKA
jgi:hypothetical protein